MPYVLGHGPKLTGAPGMDAHIFVFKRTFFTSDDFSQCCCNAMVCGNVSFQGLSVYGSVN